MYVITNITHYQDGKEDGKSTDHHPLAVHRASLGSIMGFGGGGGGGGGGGSGGRDSSHPREGVSAGGHAAQSGKGFPSMCVEVSVCMYVCGCARGVLLWCVWMCECVGERVYVCMCLPTSN